MFKIKIITWEKTKSVSLNAEIEKYEKYLQNYAKIGWVVLKDDSKILDYKEGILVTEVGDEVSSEEFAGIINEYEPKGEINFVIGGTFGFSDEVKNAFRKKISLSKMVFPHELARVMLLEQIYRGFTILNNKDYHY